MTKNKLPSMLNWALIYVYIAFPTRSHTSVAVEENGPPPAGSVAHVADNDALLKTTGPASIYGMQLGKPPIAEMCLHRFNNGSFLLLMGDRVCFSFCLMALLTAKSVYIYIISVM